MTTGMNDHTGAELFVADCVRIESHDYEWNGYITRHSGLFWVKYIEDGDEVELSKIHSEIEKLKTFVDAVETGKVSPANAKCAGTDASEKTL